MRCFTLIFAIILTSFLAFASLEAEELIDNLVLAFSFEGGTGDTIKDLSGQGNDGIINGNAQWIEGPLGQAFYFDGATYVVAPHIAFDNRSFTVQLCVKTEMAVDEVVFSQYELNTNNMSLHFRIKGDSGILMGFYSNDLEAPAGFLKKNEWRNLTFWFDESDKTRKIYVDGQEVATDVSATAYLGTKGDIWIGGWERPTKDEHPFYQIYHGAVDEVRVWQRLLDEDEIIDSINTEMPVNSQEMLITTWGKIKF